jgi:hypothetical protein
VAEPLHLDAHQEAPPVPHLVSESVAAEAWAVLEAAFGRAAGRGRPEAAWWRLAGRTVRGRIVGKDLAERLARPFAHLQAGEPAAEPDLCLDLWDGEATGVELPAGTILDTIPGWHDSGGISTVSSGSRYYIHGLFESRAILDRHARRIIGWTPSAGRLSLYERGKPFRVLLSVWLHDRGIQVVHAALVSKGGRGVLLPGRGGAGKSTSALACLLEGFRYLGDDYVGLERLGNGSFSGYSLYNSTWLEPDHLLRFPPLVPHAIRGVLSWERKRLIHLAEIFPEGMAHSAPIRLLALPQVVHRSTTRSRVASRAEAVLAMAPTSIFELTPRVGAEGFERLAALATRLPAHWLELGERLPEIPSRIDDLLAGAPE